MYSHVHFLQIEKNSVSKVWSLCKVFPVRHMFRRNTTEKSTDAGIFLESKKYCWNYLNEKKV